MKASKIKGKKRKEKSRKTLWVERNKQKKKKDVYMSF